MGKSQDDVVITGVGVVSAVGAGLAAYRNAVLERRSGIRPITEFNAEDLPVRIAGLVPELDASSVLTPEELELAPRSTRLAMLAAVEAMGADPATRLGSDPVRVGVVMGQCSGGFDVLDREMQLLWAGKVDELSKDAVPQLMDNNATSWLARRFATQGPNLCLATACATSMDCLGVSLDLIRGGRVDAVLAGGGDATVTRFSLSAFAAARALSRNNDNPQVASRPFDKERDGFVMGEASTAFFLERRGRAEARGAKIVATLCGYGTTNDAHHLVTPRPDGSGLAAAMRQALQRSGVAPADVGYISAHATSTEQGDVAESSAIRTVFGKNTDALKVGATKSIFGHSIGGAGGISSIAAVLAVSEGLLTPSMSFKTPDPECSIPVFSQPLTRQDVRFALANAAGFGGQNATLVFGRA